MSTTLKEKAYEKLKRMILQKDTLPGEYLTERALVEQLEMSRTPIRSALERLEAEGLVSYTPNKGLIVSELSIQKAVDCYDIRVALETHLVRKISSRIWTDEETRWFKDNLKEQLDSVNKNDYAAFTKTDSSFHLQLARIYGNNEIIQTMENLQDKMFRIAMDVLRKDAARIRVSHQDHLEIFECITLGKAEEAASAAARHLDYGRKILIE